MSTVLSGCFMAFVFFVFLLIQRKKYNISVPLFFVIWLVFTITGTFGASLGAVLSGLSWSGKRLHGMVFFDAIAVLLFCFVSKKKNGHIGDYISIPVISACAAAKVGCVLEGCCYGTVLFVNGQGESVRFPSQAIELLTWITLIAVLFYIEKKKRSKDLMLPISMVWFGILRYFVDFFRGSAIEKKPILLHTPAGRLYSVCTLLLGLMLLFFALRKKLGRTPKVKEYLKSLV